MPKIVKSCNSCSHYHLTAISRLRGACIPRLNENCKYKSNQKKGENGKSIKRKN